VPNTQTDDSLGEEIRYLTKELGVIKHLESYRATLDFEQIRGAKFYLVELDAPKNQTKIIGFRDDEFEEAQRVYLNVEKALFGKEGRDVVLASVGSLQSLKRAYPNYFADTEVFLGIVRDAILSAYTLDEVPDIGDES